MIESARRHGYSDPRYGPSGRVARRQGAGGDRPRQRDRVVTFVDDGLLPIAIWENEGGPASMVDESDPRTDSVNSEGKDPSERLACSAFSTRHFPGRDRHDLEAFATYGQYRDETDVL
jgi:hypothetical protein